jgi:hypothetical protein
MNSLVTRFQLNCPAAFFSQVRCDFAFKTATFSTPTDPGRNNLDEQKNSDDGESNEQIEIFFRHCPCVSTREQSNAETVTKQAKTAEIGGGFLKCLQDGSVRMPRFYRRVMATGELAQVTGDTRDGDFRKSLMKMIYIKLPKTASLPAPVTRASPAHSGKMSYKPAKRGLVLQFDNFFFIPDKPDLHFPNSALHLLDR